MPSQLLERRPDIASAERKVISANAQIGVAKAAYFPDLTLSAAGGYRSGKPEQLDQHAEPLLVDRPAVCHDPVRRRPDRLPGGPGRGDLRPDRGDLPADRARRFPRGGGLPGALERLDEESGVQREALESAREALRLAENQYKAGTVDYTDVVTNQATALSNERTVLTLLGSRLTASVQLIAAMGGGWDSADIERTDERLGRVEEGLPPSP